MAPLCAASFFLDLEEKMLEKKQETEHLTFWNQLKELSQNPLYKCIVLGQAAYCFTVGGIAFWGNYYIETYYKVDPSLAVLSFGGATVVTGLLGTFLGSLLLDWMLKPYLV